MYMNKKALHKASSTFENKHTTLNANAEPNVELECRASSAFENKHTTQYANAELNVELECRASSTFASRKTALANSEDPDETPHDAASDLALHCLLIGISCWNQILKAFANSLDPERG
ncbi:hypothetical protein DPMN_151174, partial [Dreissena polymorpha]